ncbi:MAG TPA: MOSC N-terminal beta barrel domain-containing protein [Xanthomonadaceae bacterium]|nr:MOSC N-terminal beta barrel domain-containing protein [Xanthomonadaceae bacterium]
MSHFRMILSSILIYPIKSTAGLDVPSARIEPRGFCDDRRWMIVDAEGGALTGRELSRMVLIQATPGPGLMHLDAPSMPAIDVAMPTDNAERMSVVVWGDTVDSVRIGERADAWLSEFLARPVRLVGMDARSVRHVDPPPREQADEFSFADGYPFLAISQASLDYLNAKLASPIPMRRFRPNLVVSGCGPHAEDQWERIRIGTVPFDVVKDSVRCVFTTVDPELGQRDPSGEPLRTLKTYRRSADGITFGMNLIGDHIEVH